MAVVLQRSGDWLAARRGGQCAALPANHRCAVGLLPLLRESWSISNALRNLRAQHPLRAEILCPEICPLGRVNMHLYNFLVCGPKFTRFLLANVGGAVVHQLLFRFLICPPVPEIFAIKVESCQKSRRNLDVFWRSQILGGGPFKNCTQVINPTSRHVGWKSLIRIFH